MIIGTMDGTVTQQAGYDGGWHKYDTSKQYAGFGTTSYFTAIVVFQTPNFSGLSETINITLRVLKNGNNSNPTLRWALATSDANRDQYINTISEITNASDPFQIANGTHTFESISSGGTDSIITINTQNAKPSTTYYLYLWGYESGNWLTVYYPNTHSITVNYSGGIIYIDNGSEFEAYLVYIDNGTDWDLYIPYIDNGNNWDMYS